MGTSVWMSPLASLFKGRWRARTGATVGYMWHKCRFMSIPLSLATLTVLGGIKVISCRLCHRSRTDICAHSSHFGTHSGCPLCYEMPRSSLYQKGDKV